MDNIATEGFSTFVQIATARLLFYFKAYFMRLSNECSAGL